MVELPVRIEERGDCNTTKQAIYGDIQLQLNQRRRGWRLPKAQKRECVGEMSQIADGRPTVRDRGKHSTPSALVSRRGQRQLPNFLTRLEQPCMSRLPLYS